MLDKSIPYLNIIMKRNKGTPVPEVALPNGYEFSFFSKDDEYSWAEIETSVGEFDSVPEALAYFQKEYLPQLKELERRLIFIQTKSGEKVATATIWWDHMEGRRIPTLHWIGVRPEHQGLNLGKAVVFEVVNRMLQIDGDVDLFLHTQTWSYKAIGIYLQAGFDFVKSDAIDGYKNDYEKALPLLKEKMNERI